MATLKASSQIALSQDPNDQVSSLLSTPTSIVIAGTSAGDGFITALDKSGATTLWSTRLGDSADDIATSVAKDNAGNYWVLGASATVPEATPAPALPAGTLNPGNVVVESSTALATITKLNVWKVNSKGSLVNTYSFDQFKSAILPQSITYSSGKFLITGAIASSSNNHFSILVDANGTFGVLKTSQVNSQTKSVGKEIKTTLSLWKSIVTSTAIKGLLSWKPKPDSNVLLRYDVKGKTVLAGYISSAPIRDFVYEKSIGIVVLTEGPSGYAISVIK